MTVSSPRPARPDDAQTIARVHLLSWQTAYRGLLPAPFLDRLMDAYPERVRKWEGILAAESPTGSLTFVVESPAVGIVGFASCGSAREGAEPFLGEVYAIYLLEQHRGQGGGRQLMGRCFEHLLSCGLDSLMVWMLATNPAGGFYRSLGGTLVPGKTRQQVVGKMAVTDVAFGWQRTPTVVSHRAHREP